MTPIQNTANPGRGKHDDLTQKIIGTFYDVYNELGYGFLESVYCEAMRIALTEIELRIQTEVSIPVYFRGAAGIFRADLIVNDAVLLESETGEGLLKQHESQTLHYLRATRIEIALLMNFGPEPNFKRLAMDNQNKRSVSSAVIDVEPFSSGGTE